MRFRILGPLEVVVDDGPIELGRRKQRALLAILLVDANRVVALDSLVEELWAGQPPSQAIASLQAYVSNLRRLLEPGRARGESPTVLVSQPPGYRLAVSDDDVDARVFEACAAEGHRLLELGRHADAAVVLSRGLALWRGPLLADFLDAPFAQAERGRLDELRLAALEDRISADLALGRHAALVAELEHLVGCHPFREQLHAQHILALYRSGRQADALRTYQGARRILQEELGIDPNPTLQRLHEEVLRQSPELDWSPPRAGAEPPRSAGPPPLEGGASPFVGRQEPLAVIEALLADVSDGHGRVLLVSGEPGIGKTRLVDEAARRAAAGGTAVVWGRCYDGEGSPVLWPWVQVAREVLAGTPPERRHAVLGTAAPELVPLIPELTDMVPGLVVPAITLDRETVWVRRYQAFVDLVRRASAERELLIVLDDLHWADPPSVRQLVLLAGQQTGVRLLVLATYRDVELDQGHALADGLAALAREGSVRRLRLTGLDQDEVGRVMATELGTQPDEQLAALVHDRTGGNPFFVVELTRLLASEGLLRGPQAEAVVAHEVPVGVREVLRRRLARLPEQTVAVLLVAAVVGRRFHLDVVRRATGLDEDAALDAVEAGLVSGLVVEDAETVGCYWFAHALVQEAIYEDVSRLRRARLHARVAEALRLRHGDDDSDHTLELAHHWFMAAPAGGVEVALPYVLAAAEQASDGFAYDEAERQLGRALELLARSPRSPQRSRTELELQMRLGAMLAQHQGPAAARTRNAYVRARELVDEVCDGAAVLSALRGLHEAATARAEHRDAREIAERLVEAAGRSGQPEYDAAGHLALGRTLFCQGSLHEARAYLERGLQVASDPVVEGWRVPLTVWGRILLGATLELLGRTADAAAAVDAGMRQAEGLPAIARTTALGMGSHVAVFGRAPALARERADAALTLAREGHFVTAGNYARAVLAWVRAVDGDAVGALGPLRRSVEDLQAGGAQLMMPVLLGLLAEAELLAGRPEAALDRLEDALARVECTDERFYEAEFHRLRGEALRAVSPPRSGDPEEAFRTAIRIARRQGARLLELRAFESLRAQGVDLVHHSSRPSQPGPAS